MKTTHILDVYLAFSTPANLPGQAARCCYGKRAKEPNRENDLVLTRNLRTAKHHEPWECSLVMFECVLPMFVCSQINRHRIGIGRCQQSLRLSYADPTFFWPLDVPMPKASADRFREDAALIRSLHERKASKREREIVQRHVSGHVMVEYTTWFNMREWLSLAEKRLSLEAQEETRQTIALMQDAILNTDWKDVL